MIRPASQKALLCAAALLLLTACIGCSRQPAGPKVSSVPNQAAHEHLIRADLVKDTNGINWIPLQSVAKDLGLRIKEKDGKVKLGYTDAMYELMPDHSKALSYGKEIILPDAPIRQNGSIYVTANSLSKLLGTKVQTDGRDGRHVRVGALGSANPVPHATGTDEPQKINRYNIFSVGGNRDELVAYAKKFMGVPYEFGAKPYEESKKFDCSSFTQHVFKQFGESLPRLARDQAQLGSSVTRDELQKGDLIFFSVPGRFENDKIVGHVGIYIGNGQMIHTWGDPGVQISSVDSGYWKEHLLSMRRVS
ncbi:MULTISPECIES: C40 family peptidase [unclassified Paenibacillus]|uniref:C40 family peptidase n=1 Tax=unclassified Paenibacillus TaxID=185978 RepID=UPI0008393D0D|nr:MULTISPECIES: C40 family peptidase [unclassified Paenibacillus]NWL88997.1 cell wall hydrolase [Paenibacillus sp. 79R4]